jgi:hypothetical protein
MTHAHKDDDARWNHLESKVKDDISYYEKRDWYYFNIAQTMIVIGLVSSSLAALSSALDWGKFYTTLFAIIPTLAYAIGSRLKFEDRSFFYYEITIKLYAILLNIEFRNKPIDEIITQLQQIELKTKFPHLGGAERTESAESKDES